MLFDSTVDPVMMLATIKCPNRYHLHNQNPNFHHFNINVVILLVVIIIIVTDTIIIRQRNQIMNDLQEKSNPEKTIRFKGIK